MVYVSIQVYAIPHAVPLSSQSSIHSLCATDVFSTLWLEYFLGSLSRHPSLFAFYQGRVETKVAEDRN